MMNNEEKLIERYVHLCKLMCREASDYTEERVKIHNRAMKEMQDLTETIRSDMSMANKVYAALLEHGDSLVQQSAATECLSLKIHMKPALTVLKRISRKGNRMAAMAAKRTLLIWKGRLNPNDPY